MSLSYPQKSNRCILSHPYHITRAFHACTRTLSAKEPYISAKEPYISAKESYPSLKSPIYSQMASYIRKSSLFYTQKRNMCMLAHPYHITRAFYAYTRTLSAKKSSTYLQKSTIYPQKSPMYPQKSPVYLQMSLRICKSALCIRTKKPVSTKKPFLSANDPI